MFDGLELFFIFELGQRLKGSRFDKLVLVVLKHKDAIDNSPRQRHPALILTNDELVDVDKRTFTRCLIEFDADEGPAKVRDRVSRYTGLQNLGEFALFTTEALTPKREREFQELAHVIVRPHTVEAGPLQHIGELRR